MDGKWGWYGALTAGTIHLHEGDFDAAHQLFTSENRWQAPKAESRPSLLTAEFLGDVHLEQGQAEAALARYDDVLPKALALVPKGDIVAELRRRRAECFHLLGRHEEAYAEANLGLEHCRELGDRYEEAATYRVLALSAAALGKMTDAERWFDQGFTMYAEIETPYEWGKLWLAYGDWLLGRAQGVAASQVATASVPNETIDASKRADALEAYESARRLFDGMGAKAKLAEALSRVAALTGDPTVADAAASELPPRRPAPVRPAPRSRRRRAEIEKRAEWAKKVFGVISEWEPILRLLEDVAKLARTNTPILVLGESGTGKELIAQGVHQLSERTGSFIPVNCSSLPREMVESELFGHAHGSFTGATREKAGLLEVAEGGTAFLDEIGEMPAELQARLLRFLESGELRRVGATKHRLVDTRIVAATNRDRTELTRGEGFRSDLYYRLAHAVVVLPPLRQRGEDIELLAQHFLDEACKEHGKDVWLAEAAMVAVREYSWPGNVRELKAVMKRVVILSPARHEVSIEQLALEGREAPTTLLEEMAANERGRIADALKLAGNSRTEAARILGIPRTTLIHKIRRFRLE